MEVQRHVKIQERPSIFLPLMKRIKLRGERKINTQPSITLINQNQEKLEYRLQTMIRAMLHMTF